METPNQKRRPVLVVSRDDAPARPRAALVRHPQQLGRHARAYA